LPQRRSGPLVVSFAAHRATVGKRPLVHAAQPHGPAPRAETTPSTRVSDLRDGLRRRPEVELSGPVLLVDDTIRTRWTMTGAAQLLTTLGAEEVLPLAIHQLP